MKNRSMKILAVVLCMAILVGCQGSKTFFGLLKLSTDNVQSIVHKEESLDKDKFIEDLSLLTFDTQNSEIVQPGSSYSPLTIKMKNGDEFSCYFLATGVNVEKNGKKFKTIVAIDEDKYTDFLKAFNLIPSANTI